ncbi:MAG: PRC-barrel domain-containing protein [Eggerthellaceae bacterium]|nr:PRC-barrel domain-containing protein [Eggerthellaceae bacterium]
MDSNLISTKKLAGTRVAGGAKRKRIGKVRRFVFHPTERRCIGFTVKRPDAALMFHRKDLFVALGGYDVEDGEIVVHDDTTATDRGAIKALGVDWNACVIWVGMPVVTKSGDFLGFIDDVSFDSATGEVATVSIENGAANSAILGKRMVPGKLVRGFKRGIGGALAPMGEYSGEDPSETAERGAILVADEAAEITSSGGVAAAAGKATAVVADKAKKSADRAKPVAQKAAKATGAAVEKGSFAVGRQLGRASGMFAAFKEEYDKAAHGDEGDK